MRTETLFMLACASAVVALTTGFAIAIKVGVRDYNVAKWRAEHCRIVGYQGSTAIEVCGEKP